MRTARVIVSPYDESWIIEFAKIKEEIEAAVGSLIIGVEHIGNTAVFGMSAKPCIDIDVVIEDYSTFEAVKSGLEAIGYFHEGDLGIKDREAFGYSDKPSLYSRKGNERTSLSTINFRVFYRHSPCKVRT